MENTNLQQNVELIKKCLGNQASVIIRNFIIGNKTPVDAAMIYINGLIKNERVEDYILKPLMQRVDEELNLENLCDYLIKKYIFISNAWTETELDNIITKIKLGKTVILVDGVSQVILLDTTGGEHRSITEPINETVIKGSKEGFIENIDTNLTLLRRIVKDSNMTWEKITVGRRSQTEVAVVYISDIADMDIVNEVKRRISDIDIDILTGSGKLVQCIEDYTYSFFPQARLTEKPDSVANNLMEGRIAIIVAGTPVIALVPCIFTEFFETVEDYYEKTLIVNFQRILRICAAILVITFPSVYLTLIKFNAELIPIKFITPIIQSRTGIALTPFLEIFLMEIVVEFLREGGLRLPSKIGQTLSVVGGIIIGDTAVRSKIVSPTTLFVVGVTVIATFLIPNYDMSSAIRVMRFPMLILANFLGIFGIGIGWYFILVSLCSTDSFGVPYFSVKVSDLKDIIFIAPIWKMNKRPETIPNNNMTRQTDFRKKWGLTRRKKNEQSGE